VPAGEAIEIALVNNMPDAALDATERQFRALLSAAAGGRDVRLTVYSLPEVRRGPYGRQRTARYGRLDELWGRRLDGLIVTGAEPQAEDLRDEPYWGSLTRLLEWAEASTYSTVLSCLAAHAGILFMDGIARRRLAGKQFGVFECARVCDHPLTASAQGGLRAPHSRWNDVAEDALQACGYRVLTRSPDAGVDMFVKQRHSLFVFFQGHPEYDAVTLLLEYRRDVGRYLRRERDTYPAMPRDYFDEEIERELSALRERALRDRREALLAGFPTETAAARVTNHWRDAAEQVYRNWLGWIEAARRLQPGLTSGNTHRRPPRSWRRSRASGCAARARRAPRRCRTA
jgi:homoserine O-succinyltransferase